MKTKRELQYEWAIGLWKQLPEEANFSSLQPRFGNRPAAVLMCVKNGSFDPSQDFIYHIRQQAYLDLHEQRVEEMKRFMQQANQGN